MLVGAMNLCPCGYFPDLKKCRCSPYQRKRYISKVSGPILDRMDICIWVEPVKVRELSGKDMKKGLTTGNMADIVMRARKIQKERYGNNRMNMPYNSSLKGDELKKYCELDWDTEKMLEKVFQKRNLSPRVYHRTLRLSRTIADIENSGRICQEHVMEALSYVGVLEEFC